MAFLFFFWDILDHLNLKHIKRKRGTAQTVVALHCVVADKLRKCFTARIRQSALDINTHKRITWQLVMYDVPLLVIF